VSDAAPANVQARYRPDAGHAGPALHALLIEFDSPGALLTAAEQVRDAGYTKWDTHSPYPIHGIDEAMGIRPTRLPWLVLILGLTGCAAGLVLQWWTNAVDARQFGFLPVHFQGYAFHISGKPVFSLPANIPVIFELTVLLAALGAVIGMLASNNLPLFHRPLFGHPRFRRVTTDRFFITVDAADPLFDEHRTAALLASLAGAPAERIEEPSSPARFPAALVIGGVIVVCLALLPPLWVAKARVSTSPEPRIHIIQDMANQERFKAQQAQPLFADGRELRPHVPGTLARGDLHDDPHFYEGKVDGDWATTFPPQIEITEAFVRHGQQRFNTYCAPCHGLGGAGDGIVGQRAVNLVTPGWVAPSALTTDPTVIERANGHLFNTITNGIRTMPPYGDQIPERDRWAIVAYVRALQRSQHARIEDVPPDLRAELR
jgi:mono/diheme cytochrome c family protein